MNPTQTPTDPAPTLTPTGLELVQQVLTSRVYDVAIETPLQHARQLSERLGQEVFFKREDLQPIHSFKLRGAYNRMSQLSAQERERGVICASAGNHAQGVAFSAQRLGVRAVIVMPATTPDIKVSACRARGADVRLHGDSYSDAAEYAERLQQELGLTYIHPYDDPWVIAGQGTVGLELLRQVQAGAYTVFCPVGGGGLIQIPVLLSAFPQTAIPTLFGTNKVSSIAGTGASLWRYARALTIPWNLVLPATVTALLGAWMGAAVVAWIPRDAMRPLVIVMMVVVAAYTFWRKDLGHVETHEPRPGDRWRAAAFGLVIGFYDGFFGPGTGSFLIFGFVRVFGLDFVRASASAKVINFATNISAILFFASDDAAYVTGQVISVSGGLSMVG